MDRITSRFSKLELIVDPGAAFQFTETYSGPGLSNQTIIQRETIIESATDTTSISLNNWLWNIICVSGI